MTTLSELFLEQDSDTINHRGRVVKALVRVPVRKGSVVTVSRRQATTDRPQGLKIGVDTGNLEVNGVEAPAVVLWSTTAPDKVELTVTGEGATSIDVWNCWSMGGVDSAWIGNAGMVTKATATGMVLRCSDGIGPADFSDLEIELSVDL